MLFLFIIFSAAYLASCDTSPSTTETTDPKTANEKNDQAYLEMETLFSVPGDLENKNFTAVEKLYSDAVTADPTNPTANFGAAFTHILATFNDTSILNSIRRWEGSAVSGKLSMLKFGIPGSADNLSEPTAALGNNLMKIIQVSMTSPPTIAEVQNLLRLRLLPRINYAIARLAVVETHPTFEFKVSGKMQGNPGKKSVSLDLTEVYLMDAMLYAMKAQVEQFLVFKFDMPDYTTKSAVAALQQNNPNFFVLAADGSTRALSVKNSLLTIFSKARSSLNFLKSETDNQDDDIIKQSDIAEIERTINSLARLETALNGVLEIPVRNYSRDTTFTVLNVSLNNFFSNLPQNPKQAWFPAYTVDSTVSGKLHFRFSADDYASFNFPDPTFSGLFPGMTNARLKIILYIDEAYAWDVEVSVVDQNSFNNIYSVTMTINGKTYQPSETADWGYVNFLITENRDQPVQSLNVTSNGTAVPVVFATSVPKVQFMRSDFVLVDLTRASQNTTAQHNAGDNSITVNLQQSAYYVIERSVNNSGFVKIDSLYTSQYKDMNVSRGSSYQYRALHRSSYFNWNYLAHRPNNYTNTVSVAVP